MKSLHSVLVAMLSSLFVISSMNAQTTIQTKPVGENGNFIYNQERTVNFRLHSHGIALGYEVGTIETWYKTSSYYFGAGSLKHPKERSQNFKLINYRDVRESSKPFIYGKQNRLYALRFGVGKKRYYSERAKKKSVIVGISYAYGPTLGILKPYYLKLKKFEDGGIDPVITTEKYSEENEDIFLDESLIFGGAEFKHGLDELKLRPGAHGKIGAHFNWGNSDQYIKALEVGIMADVFFSKVPIMIREENKPFFLNVYLSLQFGKRS